jgi:glycosyltransferase involved in cell wall biosynthesis
LLGETLRILRASAESTGEPFEIIVADDASTDRTAEIARTAGASVVAIDRRQIAAARNAGAKTARGDILAFVDADTHVAKETLQQALQALRAGAVGGGAPFDFEDHAPYWGHLARDITVGVMRLMSYAAGCFIFVRRDAFDAVGGFDERYYALEELVLSRALHRIGKFVLVERPVLTSGRKTRFHGPGALWKFTWDVMRGGHRAVQSREKLGLWYDGKR